jgi:hypothetical protein
VQEIKRAGRRHQADLDVFDQEAVLLKQQRAEKEGRLAQAVERVRERGGLRDNFLSKALPEVSDLVHDAETPLTNPSAASGTRR